MLRHPFERLTREQLAWATMLLAAAWAGLTGVLVYAMPGQDLAEIRLLLAASSPAVASKVLSAWPPALFQSFSFMLGFDLLYDIVHNNTVALLAVWGARRLSHPMAALAAGACAWVMWLDTALNVFENLAFLNIIRSLEPWPLLPWATAVFEFRSATLGVAVAVGILLHALAFWRGRRPSDGPTGPTLR